MAEEGSSEIHTSKADFGLTEHLDRSNSGLLEADRMEAQEGISPKRKAESQLMIDAALPPRTVAQFCCDVLDPS